MSISTISDLVNAGRIEEGTVLVLNRRSGPVKATIVTGQIKLGRKTYETPTAAAKAVNGGSPVNGWAVWRVKDTGTPLTDLRPKRSIRRRMAA